jgi:hypothetical protein
MADLTNAVATLQEYVDIEFQNGKQTMYAHRVVMAQQSKKMRELISSDIFCQPGLSKRDISFVSMDNPVHFEALSVILEFIYTVLSLLHLTPFLLQMMASLYALAFAR